VAITDFDEHPGVLMIESGASAGHGAGRIVGKDGSGGQIEGIFAIRRLSGRVVINGLKQPPNVIRFFTFHRINLK